MSNPGCDGVIVTPQPLPLQLEAAPEYLELYTSTDQRPGTELNAGTEFHFPPAV